jgi:hypothetical protein
VEGNLVFIGVVALCGVLGLLFLWLSGRLFGQSSQRSGEYQMPRELGMEATDMDAFNTAMSRNAPLGEVPQELQVLGRKYSTHVAKIEDDETYAARYHAAFGKSEKKE